MAPILGSVPHILSQAERLKGNLKSSVNDFSVGSEGWSSRQRLQDLYKTILLTDLEFALDKKIEQDLWNSAFKTQIDFLRLQAKEKKNTKRNEIQAVLTLFLEAASGFYIQLLQELCLTYKLDIPGHVRSAHLGILEEINGNSCSLKKPHTQSCHYICQDCLVHLGDIARYCDDATQAEVFYNHALVLVPSNGQPYNQLAILASAKGEQLETVYFYCRSIAVKNPFPAASTNLHKTLNKICGQHNTKVSSAGLISKAEIVHLFLQFHGHVYLVQDFVTARALKSRVIDEIKVALREAALSPSVLLQLVAITLFTPYNVRSSGADDLEDFDCIGKDEEDCWQMAVEFAMDFFNVLVLHVSERLPSEENTHDAVLPALSLLCQWFSGSPSSIWQEESVKSTTVWGGFAAMLNSLQVSCGQLPDKSDVPLQEDWELQGFLPLRVAHRKLNFTVKRTKPENEAAVRIGRLVKFATRLVNGAPRILSKLDDLNTGLSKFSLKMNSPSPWEEYSVPGGKLPKPPQDIDLESAGQKLLASLPNLQRTSPCGTPFAETSSLFKSSLDSTPGDFSAVPPSPSSVAQYSLFQSGWNAPLTSAALASGNTAISSPHLSPRSSPRTTPTDNLAFGGNSHPGSFPTTPVEGPQAPGFATSLPVGSSKGAFSPSPTPPFGGFGLSGSWGTGVWAPVPKSANGGEGNRPATASESQAVWGSRNGPAPGLTPLQQLLQDQKRNQKQDLT